MFPSWRSRIREAEDAFKQGRLEKAGRLICEGGLQHYLPGQRLAAKVAAGLIERARRYERTGDTATAWRDLDAAGSLNGEPADLKKVQQALVARTLREVEDHLAAGDGDRAAARLEDLEHRGITSDRIRRYQDAARRLQAASDLSRQGRFADAQEQLAAAARLLPGLKAIDRQRKQCGVKLARSRKLTDQLQRALIGDDWSASLLLAERLLDLAPESRVALDALRRAREKVGAKPSAGALAETQYWPGARQSGPDCSTAATVHVLNSETVIMDPPRRRFLLWVDGVGGYLVCLGEELIIGQAMPGTRADIPILGDLSRHHAKIRRRGEDYLIDPVAGVWVQGKPIHGTTVLSDGDLIRLGPVVQLRYRRPHALSASARLEFASRHRTQPWADAVVLMAESCVLGPNWHNHVVCPDWSEDLVLYRTGDQLHCRGAGWLEIDGKKRDGAGPIAYNSRVAGEDFSLSLEEI